ncbi:hypothetical protein Lser_V15G17522 [Lactuca serriola]
MNHIKNWQLIVDRFNSKLSTWKAKTLSFGGRFTLINSVLGNIPTYYLSLFKAPCGVINSLEKIRRQFLWGSNTDKQKINWVSWDKVIAPKKMGGLGVGSLQALNLALMAKWWWRHKLDNTSLWSQVITSIHNLSDKPANHLSKKIIVGVWNNIAGAKLDIEKKGVPFNIIIQKSVSSGTDTLFWQDEWIHGGKLKDRFPGLYLIESKKRCKVAERIQLSGFEWNWDCDVAGADLSLELAQLMAVVALFIPRAASDSWKCGLDSSGIFTTKAMRAKLVGSNMSFPFNHIDWIKEAPLKVLTFVWRGKNGQNPLIFSSKSTGSHHQLPYVRSV